MTDYASVKDEIRRELATAAAADEAMTRVVAILKARIPAYTWVGIYRREDADLILGPYVGKPSPHTRIPIGRGICGAAAAAGETIVVDDVNADERYLACSVETQSEIVVPVIRDGVVLAEIDIDSDTRAAFGRQDQELLEAVAALLAEKL